MDSSIESITGNKGGDQSGHCSWRQRYNPRILPPLPRVELRLKVQAPWNGGHRHHQGQGMTSHKSVSKDFLLNVLEDTLSSDHKKRWALWQKEFGITRPRAQPFCPEWLRAEKTTKIQTPFVKQPARVGLEVRDPVLGGHSRWHQALADFRCTPPRPHDNRAHHADRHPRAGHDTVGLHVQEQ